MIVVHLQLWQLTNDHDHGNGRLRAWRSRARIWARVGWVPGGLDALISLPKLPPESEQDDIT